MKKAISALLAFVMLLGLCACGEKEPAPSTTTAPVPPTASSGPVHCHTFHDADCVTPKTCTDCGETRGEALGHDYNEGTCSHCGEEDPTYVALLDGDWRTEALNDTGSQMECIILRFHEDGTARLSAGIYDRLSDVPEDQRKDSMMNEDNWYDYSGEIYYYAGFGVYDVVSYSVEGDTITCTLGYDDTVAGTMILERTAGNMLTVTYFEGPFSVSFLQVGDVLNGEQ